MIIKLESANWWEKRRKIFHILPSFIVDYRSIDKYKGVSLILSWLFWSIGVCMETNERA